MGLFSTLLGCLEKNLIRSRAKADGSAISADELPKHDTFDLFFDLRSLQIATNFFSDFNKLGHGGFGPVFKVRVCNFLRVLFFHELLVVLKTLKTTLFFCILL